MNKPSSPYREYPSPPPPEIQANGNGAHRRRARAGPGVGRGGNGNACVSRHGGRFRYPFLRHGPAGRGRHSFSTFNPFLAYSTPT